jgi:hypothetical protein
MIIELGTVTELTQSRCSYLDLRSPYLSLLGITGTSSWRR